jgi:hypothetical protein
MSTRIERLTPLSHAMTTFAVSCPRLKRAMSDLKIVTQNIPHSSRGKGITDRDMKRIGAYFAASAAASN